MAELNPDALVYAEAQLRKFQKDPESVDPSWQAFLQGDDSLEGPSFPTRSLFDPAGGPVRAPIPGPTPPAVRSTKPAGDVLSQVPLFSGLTETELEAIAQRMAPITMAAGEVIFSSGDPGDALYLILSGSVQVTRGSILIATLGPGEPLGELSVLDDRARSATARTSEKSTLLMLPARDFHAIMEKHARIARSMVVTVSQRLRRTNMRQERVDQLIHAYRVRGHTIARIDPLDRRATEHPELALEFHGLSEEDLDLKFTSRHFSDQGSIKLRHIIDRLRNTYCRSIGVQFMHIDDIGIKQWLQSRMESTGNRRSLSREEQLRILSKLTDAEQFEQFLHKKFLGAKRFSLEGGETLIPLMDQVIEESAQRGVRHVVIGMAHRGRLNIMANIMGKSPAQIFAEFDDADAMAKIGCGDVKYHLGFSSLRSFGEGEQVQLTLCFNPSHLEFVGPVVMGRVRARQDRLHDEERKQVMGLVIHGDAAFAGQGVVQESLNLSELEGYRTGGTVHLIVNNQIGFTTPPESSRSTAYSTDVARMLDVPVFHVNGEDPEAVSQVIRLAMEFRDEFRRDVIIDMYCFRKYGHNEGDEPTFTNPLMYDAIRSRGTVRESYLENLQAMGQVTADDGQAIMDRTRNRLERCLAEARGELNDHESFSPEIAVVEDLKPIPGYGFESIEEEGVTLMAYCGGRDRDCPEVDTHVDETRLKTFLEGQLGWPEGFQGNKKLKRILAARAKMAAGEQDLDWGAGESLAYASLLDEGVPIRLSGQDAGRGTFAHRHSVFHDTVDGSLYVPLQKFGDFGVWDSPLSECAVLAFEYGYSLEMPEALTIWEAQFGDFANGAQVIIDQFITSSEDKWNRFSGLVMMLPHGFEGMGPEHSSARLERFLTMAAEDNIQVMNLTTSAQIFHALRRQIRRRIRKPLVIMTPKSLLRLKAATSTFDDLSQGGFQKVICEDDGPDPAETKRILICSGKVYYDLCEARKEHGMDHVSIVRMEQLYPLPDIELQEALKDYADETPLYWVQEEPENMGTWPSLLHRLGSRPFGRFDLKRVCRPESASPATGSAASHKYEQDLLCRQALGIEEA